MATSLTYGQIRFLLSKEMPGIDTEKLDGYINDRFTAILNKIPWQRIRVNAILTTLPQYTTGKVSVTNGLSALVLTGGAWTTQMSGFRFRITGDTSYYTFTRTAATTGTIDRPYENATVTLGGYSIFQPIYALQSGAEAMEDVTLLDPARPVLRKSQAQLAQIAPDREQIGAPAFWSPYSDDSSTPPLSRVELYPAPDLIYDLPYWYTPDPTLFGPNDTASLLPAWMDAGCLKAGVKADMFVTTSPGLASTFEAKFRELLAEMINKQCRISGAKQIRMASRFTRHRVERALKGTKSAPFILP